MKKQKFAVCTIVYNDEVNVKACIKNWKGVVDKHLVLVSETPWKGEVYKCDKSYDIALDMGVDAVLGRWVSEADQRNWGLARLYDYDHVLIVDADEFFTRENQEKILDFLDALEWCPVSTPKNTHVYWKTYEYVLDPGDESRMILSVDPKSVLFTEARTIKFINGNGDTNHYLKHPDVASHHFSYVKTNEAVLQKLTSYEHAESIVGLREWYENVWLKWEPGSDMLVRPRGVEPSKAIYRPAPQEIIDLFK